MVFRVRLKPLHEQVVVVLGASSGIGRETALQCAARGARVVVAARGEPGLVSLVEEIEGRGGQATWVRCDVTDAGQVTEVAETAVRTFGRIDTWVNAAAVAVYATFENTAVEEFQRVIDVNLMGYVRGMKAALPHLRREGRGALIVISSVECRVAMPLQSAYAASKHAIEGTVDALRRELKAEGVPVSVTSIKPTVIDTPFFANALSKIGYQPTAPAPHYHPSVVAGCVVYAAEHPVRDLYAGGSGRVMTALQAVAPRLLDTGIARVGIPLQRTDDAPGKDALYAARSDNDRARGSLPGHTFRMSPYTWLQTHPKSRFAAMAAVVLGVAGRLASPGKYRS